MNAASGNHNGNPGGNAEDETVLFGTIIGLKRVLYSRVLRFLLY